MTRKENRNGPEQAGPNTGKNQQNLDTKIIAENPPIKQTPLTEHVIPIKPRDKEPWVTTPDVNGKYTWTRAFSYPEEFPDGCNYGLKLGLGTIADVLPGTVLYRVVFDYDDPVRSKFRRFYDDLSALTGGMLSNTLIVRSGGKHNGWHNYVYTDKPFSYAEFFYHGVKVQVLGQGHYIVIPPSVGIKAKYKLCHPETLKEYPETELLEFLGLLEIRPALVPLDNLLSTIEKLRQKSSAAPPTRQKPSITSTEKEKALDQNTYLNSKYFEWVSKGANSKCFDSINTATGTVFIDCLEVEEGNDENVKLNENICYESMGFLPISWDPILWEHLVAIALKKAYGGRAKLKTLASFRCPFHPEANNSASVFLNRRTLKRYFHEFHNNGATDDKGRPCKNFDIVEFFQALEKGREPTRLLGLEWALAEQGLMKYIKRENVKTGFCKKFDEWNHALRLELTFPGGGDWKKYIIDTLDALLYAARPEVNQGKTFIATLPHLEKEITWNLESKYKISLLNRSINFLAFAGLKVVDGKIRPGLLVKGPEYRIRKTGRKTYRYWFNYEVTADDIAESWEDLNSKGLADYRAFNYSSIYNTYGALVADYLFRVKPKSQGRGKRGGKGQKGRLYVIKQ